MLVQVKIIGNLPYMIKGIQRQYADVELADGATLADLLRQLNINRELLAFVDGQRLVASAALADGMEITIISPAAGG